MFKKSDNDFGIVYSTEHGKMCPTCSNPILNCNCQKKKKSLPNDGIVRVSRETKGRKGKGMTIITGISLSQNKLKKLAKELKQKCGSGGSIKGDIIEIQGEHRDKLIVELTKKGYNVIRSGG